MSDPRLSDDVARYYRGYDERGRLQRSDGRVEFARTCEIAQRVLPPPPAVVADVGGGPGAYAVWLARSGYRVVLRDAVSHHVEQAREDTAGLDVDAGVADARALDLSDASVDAVLLLGPLYHLPERDDRVRALREAMRLVRPGGPVVAAAISRWAPFLDGAVVQRLHERLPGFVALLDRLVDDGHAPPQFEGDFTGYSHRPDDLRREVLDAGLELEDVCGVEGIAFALGDLDARWADERMRYTLLDVARRVEHVPELMGLSPHMLALARRPAAD